MSKEIIQKVIRCFVVALCFLGLLTILGMQEREAQQYAFALSVMLIFGLLLRNIWLTLFLGWTIFLYCFFKFEVGQIYLTNIFYGCILYYLVKISFEKQHINFFINGVLWFLVLNIVYGVIQLSGYDFIYAFKLDGRYIGELVKNSAMVGFMGQRAVLGAFMAVCVPLLASRASKWAIVGAVGLFFPLFLMKASLCLIAGAVGLIFVLWFRLKKWIWGIIAVIMIVFCAFYITKCDIPSSARLKQWKQVLSYAKMHPVTGWGLDSFRNITSYKDFRFMALHREEYKGDTSERVEYVLWWDNPHNLLVSLQFEFGIVGVFLLFGYLRQCGIRFYKSIKDSNTIALSGFILVILIASMAQFPMYLARFAVIIIPVFSLFEIQTT